MKYRDAVTGEYVSEEYAKENPNTTVSEETVNSNLKLATNFELMNELKPKLERFETVL